MEEKFDNTISKACIQSIMELDIPLNQRCMLLLMAVKSDENGYIRAKVREIQMHYTLNAAQVLIKHLARGGYVEKVEITKKGNLYKVNFEKIGEKVHAG